MGGGGIASIQGGVNANFSFWEGSMEFQSQGRPISDGGMDKVAETLGVAESEVWAVLTVETRGFGFLADRRPQILFERHVFHRLTDGKFDDGNPGIS